MIKQLRISVIFVLVGFYATAQSILGIDVSGSQGAINWTQVKAAGYVFAWAKATEGITFTDASYATNAVNGVSAGMYMGAYHFARPDNNPTTANAVSEANNFLSSAQAHIANCELTPILDYEVSPSLTWTQQTAWIQTWMNTVQTATGIVPILYTSGSIASSLGSSLASYCKLWIADPDGSATVAPGASYLGAWNPNWAFKQYSWTGSVPGISGNVDMDVFNGTLAGLKTLMGCSTIPPVCHYYYASLPYTTSFENTWLYDSCSVGAERIPDKYWKNTIGGTSPNGNDYWHRDDYTNTDWTSVTTGSYTPTGSIGSHSAKFHNDPPPAGSTGSLDLYINLSSAGTKQISFDYIHAEASPSPFSFDVQLSTDGGATFPTTLHTITTASFTAWTAQSFTTSSNSATSVIRFKVTDKGTNDIGIDNINIIGVVAATPTAAISSANTGCVGSSISLLDASTGSPTSWIWSMAGGTPSSVTTQSTTVTYATAGVKTITLTVANGTGTSTAVKSITITANPTVTASITNTTICKGNSVTENLTGATTYTWLPSGSGATSTLTPTSTNIYTITGSNSGCNSIPITVTINVTATPTLIVTPASATICAGQSTTLTASGASIYTWMPGALTTSAIAVTPTAITIYTVTGTNGTCNSTKTVAVNVTSTPTVIASVTNTTICSGTAVIETLTGATTYTWLPSGLGATSTLMPTSTTIYTITGSVGLCTSTPKIVTVNVNPNPTINVSLSSTLICIGSSATLTANGGTSYTWSPSATLNSTNGSMVVANPTTTTVYTVIGTNGTCNGNTSFTLNVSTCTDINNVINTPEVIIYPNPNNGNFIIKTNAPSKHIHAEVYDQLGQLVFYKDGNVGEDEIYANDLSEGVYFANVYADGVKLITQKLIVNKTN